MIMIKQKKLIIEKKTLIFTIVLFFIAPPDYLSNVWNSGLLYYFLQAGMLFSYLYIIYLWISRRKFSAIVLPVAAMYGVIIISTIINNGDLFAIFVRAVGVILMVMLVDSEKDQIDYLWKAAVIYLTLMMFITFVTILVYPNGLEVADRRGQTLWFYSVKNGLGKPLLCLLFFTADYSLRKYNMLKWYYYVIAALSWTSVYLIKSSTSLVALTIMIVLTVFAPVIRNRQFKLFNIYVFLGIIAFAFILFVVLQNVWIFSSFIVNVLNKSVTFNGRSGIWQAAISRILQKPILGYGYLSTSQFVSLIGHHAASDAHNYLLTIGVYGGIVSIVLFLIVLLLLAKSVRKQQFEYSGITITMFVFAFLLMMNFENTSNRIFWLILSYGCSLFNRYDTRAKKPHLANKHFAA